MATHISKNASSSLNRQRQEVLFDGSESVDLVASFAGGGERDIHGHFRKDKHCFEVLHTNKESGADWAY